MKLATYTLTNKELQEELKKWPPRIPIFHKLYNKLHMWSGRSGFFHKFLHCWPTRVDKHYMKDAAEEIRKEIDRQTLEQILGINNLTPKENTEALTIEKLNEQAQKYDAKRLCNIHGSRWTDSFYRNWFYGKERTTSLSDEGINQRRI